MTDKGVKFKYLTDLMVSIEMTVTPRCPHVISLPVRIQTQEISHCKTHSSKLIVRKPHNSKELKTKKKEKNN